MAVVAPILLVVFVILALSVGIQRTMQILPALIIFGILFWLFGWIIINFFWVFVLIWFIRSLSNSGNTRHNNRSRTRYYKTYSGKEAEEFFKQFYEQNENYQNYQSNFGQNNFNSGIKREEYYKILEVQNTATKEEIRKAYLKKVKENHPDRFTNASENEKKYHEEKLKKINEAYDNLMKEFS